MTMQLTFHRGGYTGNWVEDPETDVGRAISEATGLPAGGSGSLHILFKDKEEIVLVDKAEHAAQKVFNNYCEPDWHHIAEGIWDHYKRSGQSLSSQLKAVAEHERHIEHDAYEVGLILKTLATRDGYDPTDLDQFDD